jgi:hypothetical protein
VLSSFVLVWSHPKWWQLFQVGILQGLLAKRGWQKCENTFSSEMCERFFRRRQFNLDLNFNSYQNNFRRILKVSSIQLIFSVQIECCNLQIKWSVIQPITIIKLYYFYKISFMKNTIWFNPLSLVLLCICMICEIASTFLLQHFILVFLFYYFILFYAPQFYISRLQKMDGFWKKKSFL